MSGLAHAPDPFVSELVGAVERYRAEADQRIARAAVGWPLDRMAVVDRLVLRLAVAELLDHDAVPVAVVIDEAVELAKTYSTEESGGFVNGVLSSIAAEVRPDR
jgi:N utilization substance protein B